MDGNLGSTEALTCSICAKGFDNKKSQVRHISYCRRTRHRIRSRKKSCLACSKAKTRCDLAYPSCSRCTVKQLSCEYEPTRRPETAVSSPYTPIEQQLVSSPAAPILDFSPGLVIPEHEAGPYYPRQGSIINSSQFIPPGTPDCDLWNLECTSSNPMYMGDAAAQTAVQNTQLSRRLVTPELSPSMEVSHNDGVDALLFSQPFLKATKSFKLRKVKGHQFSLNRRYVLCTLHSYPAMVVPGMTLPPFIHSQCMADILRDGRVVQKSLPQPLANCAAIVQMWPIKNESNVVFIWKSIRIEQERLSSECSKYDGWATVAALQAITVYMLLRASEKNEEATNFDVPLIYTMFKLANRAKQLIKTRGTPYNGSVPTWDEWILAESLRRTIAVLSLLELLFDVASSVLSYTCDESQMPLPCGRRTWKATSSIEWSREYTNARIEAKGVERQLTYGDLLNATSRGDGTLDSWLSQLDEFGTLVMAAASMTV